MHGAALTMSVAQAQRAQKAAEAKLQFRTPAYGVGYAGQVGTKVSFTHWNKQHTLLRLFIISTILSAVRCTAMLAARSPLPQFSGHLLAPFRKSAGARVSARVGALCSSSTPPGSGRTSSCCCTAHYRACHSPGAHSACPSPPPPVGAAAA
jgi:hypothetical protein